MGGEVVMADRMFTTGFMIAHHSSSPDTDVFYDFTPAEVGLLADLVRAARPADHPDRWGLVTAAERDAFLAWADRETARRRQAREGAE